MDITCFTAKLKTHSRKVTTDLIWAFSAACGAYCLALIQSFPYFPRQLFYRIFHLNLSTHPDSQLMSLQSIFLRKLKEPEEDLYKIPCVMYPPICISASTPCLPPARVDGWSVRQSKANSHACAPGSISRLLKNIAPQLSPTPLTSSIFPSVMDRFNNIKQAEILSSSNENFLSFPHFSHYCSLSLLLYIAKSSKKLPLLTCPIYFFLFFLEPTPVTSVLFYPTVSC